jgi:hypothetical protein
MLLMNMGTLRAVAVIYYKLKVPRVLKGLEGRRVLLQLRKLHQHGKVPLFLS